MARGRRGQDESPVSFFAFQDVMMCTIGITIITTLILILQLGRTASTTRSSTTGATTLSADQELNQLVAAHEALTKQVSSAELARDTDAESTLSKDALSLHATAEDLERMKREILSAREELSKVVHAARSNDKALLALELMRRRDELQDELKAIANRRRIVYLVAKSEAFVPLVTEISSARVVVSTDQSHEAPLSLPSSDPESAAQAIIGVFQSLPDRDRRYFLLVLKPSGIPAYLRLKELLLANPDTRDIRIGLDLIPEDCWTTDEFPAHFDVGGGANP